MPKLIKPIYAVRPGKVHPEMIPEGEDVTGRLEEIARDMGAIRATKAMKKAPETK